MAALSGITAVRPTSNTRFELVNYGATIAAGVPVYIDSADSKHKIADANSSKATAAVVGLSMTPGVDAGQGIVAKGGSVILVGTTMTVGVNYYAGPTAGEIIPEADLASGDYVTRLGTAATATKLDLSIVPTGIQKP